MARPGRGGQETPISYEPYPYAPPIEPTPPTGPSPLPPPVPMTMIEPQWEQPPTEPEPSRAEVRVAAVRLDRTPRSGAAFAVLFVAPVVIGLAVGTIGRDAQTWALLHGLAWLIPAGLVALIVLVGAALGVRALRRDDVVAEPDALVVTADGVSTRVPWAELVDVRLVSQGSFVELVWRPKPAHQVINGRDVGDGLIHLPISEVTAIRAHEQLSRRPATGYRGIEER